MFQRIRLIRLISHPVSPSLMGFLTLPEGLMRRTYDKEFIALPQREYEI